MPHDFKGKTVLITGGARGQGAAEARLFVQAGANVIAADVLDAEGGALAAALGGNARYRHLDVTNESDWLNAMRFAHETFGGLHVLVNNAGIALRGKTIGATTREDWDRVLGVNLTGPFLGTRAAAPLIRDSGGGAIVNIGSTAGINGHFAAAYSAAKWGLRGLTKCAAMEYADWNIRVNAVHPGIVATPMVEGSDTFVEAMTAVTALRRPAQPDDVAQAVLFLASEEAKYLTGIDLPVDGGFTALGVYREVWQRASQGTI
jgi:NAD(P)-dependent dehydrogenase (short-subunit alcohol dehydrogenase family)